MERNVLVDKLKGYACFLVLFGHVIMGIRLAGIDIPQFFEGMEKFIWSFHVALFLFLSGVVYSMTGEWTGKKTKSGFMLYKLYTLGVPYVVFSVVYILINSFVGQVNTQSSVTDILKIGTTPVAQYWFLYALFFLFCIWAALSGIMKNWQITLLAILIAYMFPIVGIPLGCMEVVFYSALPFGLGTCVDFQGLLKPSAPIKWIVIALHVAVAVTAIIISCIESAWVKEIMLLFGIYSSIMFISIIGEYKIISRFLMFMNKYSFQTYLLHTIFTAGIRIVMQKMNITWWWLHIIVGVICGIGFSVLAAEIAKRVKFLNFFFFPARVLKLEARKK